MNDLSRLKSEKEKAKPVKDSIPEFEEIVVKQKPKKTVKKDDKW